MKRGLILYAGCGGFRYGVRKFAGWQWTAVEIRPDIAAMYADLFPDDEVICGDAHQYLLDHFNEFDFIQSSPPCPSHSRIRFCLCEKKGSMKPVFPDVTLWQEIVFLETRFKGIYFVENVVPYYSRFFKVLHDRLIILDRHYCWTNAILFGIDLRKKYDIPAMFSKNINGRTSGFNVCDFVKNDRVWFGPKKYPKVRAMRTVLRNMFEPEIAEYVFGSIDRQIT